MIYALQIRKQSKSVNDPLLRYLTKEILLEKKLRILYEVKTSQLNLQPIIRRNVNHSMD
jgi:hypothetical protein